MPAALLVKQLGVTPTGATQILWLCDPPMPGYDPDTKPAEYVISSAATVPPTGPETYLFAATSDGDVACWTELPGSFRGSLDHYEAIRRAGYEVLL